MAGLRDVGELDLVFVAYVVHLIHLHFTVLFDGDVEKGRKAIRIGDCRRSSFSICILVGIMEGVCILIGVCI